MSKLLASTAAVVCLLPALARAQATRTWVSGVGDDANPGSRTAPCKTFAGAISKTAPGGVIDVLDPGGFGAVTITKSITIEGDAAEGSILVSGTSGIVINAGANDVVILRNLTFEGLGTGLAGVNILSAGAVHLEHCRFNGFISKGINFQTGVTNAQLYVADCTLHGCAPAAINLVPTAPATVRIDHTSITRCADGLVVGALTRAVVSDTTASGNTGVGFSVGSGGELTLQHVTATDNLTGVESTGVALLIDSTVADNVGTGLKHTGKGKILSSRNNVIYGNATNGSPTAVQGSK